ncbi:PAS domain S-box protein [Mitsuaria sp. CC2]|uniref:ATP-binding protein n=1 Tax=Mitsuaria sp. CC2 TaxID=3029186 RepID=UPI003B8B7BC3
MPLSIAQSRRLVRSTRLAGVLLALAALLGVLLMAWRTRADAIDAAADRTRLLARVLEDQATRTVDAAALGLTTIADGMGPSPAREVERLDLMLRQLVAAQPSLRAAAVLDSQGRILASSAPRDVGQRVAINGWGPIPPAGTTALMRSQPGRGLTDANAQLRGDGLSFLPLVLPWIPPLGGEGAPLYLVAAINPDAIANYQQSTLEELGQAAALFSYGGQLLAATTTVPLTPGSWQKDHRLFRTALPAQDHGEWRGPGLQPGAQLFAYRVSRTRPLVVAVEQSEHAALATWRRSLWWDAGALLILELLVFAATTATLRALEARARARRVLDDAHQRLASSEREMSVVLRSVQELIFRTDAQGRLSFVNARWALLTDGSPDQLLGKPVAELAAHGDRASVGLLFAPDEDGSVRTSEATFATTQGGARRFALAVVPLRAGDEVRGFAGSAVDITDRRAAESRLQHQLDLVALLLELSPQPTSMVDREGCYVTVNRAWEQFTGRSRAEVIGQPVSTPMPEAEAEPSSSDWVPFEPVRGRSLLRYETQLRDREGDCRDVVVSKVVVPGDRGQTAGVLFTLTDVSEFRRAERATLEAKEAAEESSRVKSEFIANISHELRTPLQSIIGYSELGMTRGAESAPRLASMFSDIHSSGRRMLSLVNDLLDVSKLESAVGTFDLERCDLRLHVASVVREFDPLLASRRLRISVSQATAPLVARVDPLRFQQVIRNILANAIRFSPEGGIVGVQTESTASGEALITVMDRGPGIPPSELECIFDAFIQSSATKDGSGGTGLGLAICRKILAVLGGRVSARNREGGGSAFEVALPMGAPEDVS